MNSLGHLFEPIMIGNMEVKNRLVMPPMGINFGVDEEGNVTEQLWEYLRARAKGGTGMIVVGGGGVHPSGLDLPKVPSLFDDKYIPELKKMTECIHEYGAKFGMQLLHGGRQVSVPTVKKVAPSAIPACGVVKGIPKELSIEEIKELVESYGDSTMRCKEAGFDFVEIHGAHGYLITQFLAKNSNKRQDEYGGSFENRIRFLIEVLRDIRDKAGPDFPVGVRFNGYDYIKDGWTLEEAKRLAPILENEGADYLHVSAGIYGSFPPGITIPSMYVKQGVFIHLAEEVKKVVSIPVIGVGRIKDPAYADTLIREGKADMISMGRAHLADPEVANKAFSGNLADIRPCIGCCMGCVQNIFNGGEATCVMNPEVSREYLLKGYENVVTPKKILVVGAGPSGLAVSRIAAIRGHNVIVCEEKGYFGGMLRLAGLPPGRSDLMDLVKYYQRELDKLSVEIRLNVILDEELIDSINPDVVVVATGSLPKMPQIEGLFDTDMNMHTAVDVLERDSIPGDRSIIIGGNLLGLEIADYLSEQGKEVVALQRDKHFAMDMAANDRTFLMERLKRPEVQLFKNVSIKEFFPRGITFTSGEKEMKLDGFESIIIAEGMTSIQKVSDMFKNRGCDIHVIGDAKDPRGLLESQSEADEIGRKI